MPSPSSSSRHARRHSATYDLSALLDLPQVESTVAEIMTAQPVSVPCGVSPADAISLMHERRIRHLFIVDARGDYLGMAHLEGIVRAARRREPIKSAIVADAAVVRPHTSAQTAAEYMLRTRTKALPVLDAGGNLRGVVTEADFVRWYVRLAAEQGAPSLYETSDEELPSGARITVVAPTK